MATTTQEQIESFRRFASEEIRRGSTADIDELYARWRVENPTQAEREEVSAIIRQGDEDIAAGRGRPADEVNEELHQKYGLSAE